MAHKVHPKMYRIKGMEDWNSRGFYGKKISQYLEEDFIIKESLKKKLADASVEQIEIDRTENKVNIIIKTARPGLIIGRGGEGIGQLKGMLAKELTNRKSSASFFASKGKTISLPHSELKIEIREVRNPWTSASLVSQWMAQQIEKRTPFRKVLKMSLDKVMTNKDVKGVRVQVAGRLNGVEIARTEWLQKGQLPRQTLRADIDYAQAIAYCTYGVIGITVWIYKGERFKKDGNKEEEK